MNTRIGWVALAGISLWLAACDPKTPVQTSDIDTQVDQKIAAHNADSAAHAGLPIHVNQLVEGIGSGQITDGSITSSDIADATITSTQIADGGITSAKLAGGAVNAQAIGANAVQTAAIGDLMVTTAKINNGAVTTTQISATAGILGTQLANGTITTTQINGAAGITGGQLAATTVAAGNIVNNTITAGQIANATITTTQLAAAANIAGTQLSNAANILGTQLMNATITGGKIASDTITDSNLKSFTTGRESDAAMFHDFYFFQGGAGNPTVVITFLCAAEGAADGTIELFEVGGAAVSTTICPKNNPGNPMIFKVAPAALNNNKSFTLRAKAGTNSPVFWRDVHVALQ